MIKACFYFKSGKREEFTNVSSVRDETLNSIAVVWKNNDGEGFVHLYPKEEVDCVIMGVNE